MRVRVLAGLLLLVASTTCSSSQTASQPSPSRSATVAEVASSPTPATAPSPAPATVSAASSRYGQILVDGSGRTLYLFDAESGPQPRCYDACAQAWPPLLTAAEPVAGPSLSAGLLTTAMRSDGARQVAYNGHPLYYYAGDHAPGEILCQAAFEYGGGWYVLDLQGNKISQP